MSELMKHAPEPWSVSALGNGIHAGDISICQFYNRSGTDFPNFEANSRRIVACVNACEGLSTERLEKFLGAAANKSVIRLTTDNLDLKARIAELEQKLDDSFDSDSAAHIRITELERQLAESRDFAWAKCQGGELPTRREQSLLFANLQEHFKGTWYWSDQEHESNTDYAWYQYFYYSNKGITRKDHELRARAVRRVIVECRG